LARHLLAKTKEPPVSDREIFGEEDVKEMP
jgi:hypothetical protein